MLVEIGPLYGYFPNGSKTHILAKPQHAEAAREIFKDTGIVITTEGERYLGGAIGSPSFVRQLVEQKVDCWKKELEKLGKFADTQPHAAFAAFTHGLSSKWTYLLRVIDWEENQLDDIHYLLSHTFNLSYACAQLYTKCRARTKLHFTFFSCVYIFLFYFSGLI